MEGFHGVKCLGFEKRRDDDPFRFFFDKLAADCGPDKAPSAEDEHGFIVDIHTFSDL
jgi:hypothetical protein